MDKQKKVSNTRTSQEEVRFFVHDKLRREISEVYKTMKGVTMMADCRKSKRPLFNLIIYEVVDDFNKTFGHSYRLENLDIYFDRNGLTDYRFDITDVY